MSEGYWSGCIDEMACRMEVELVKNGSIVKKKNRAEF